MKEGIDNLHDEELDEFFDYPLHSTAVEVELFDKDVAPHHAKSTPPQPVSSPKKKRDKRKNLENNKANNYKAKKSKKISEKANLKETTVRKTSSKKPANMKTLAPSPALKSVRKSPKSKQLPNIDPGSEDEVLEHTSESGSQGSKTRASLSSKSSSSTPAAGLPFENEIEHQPSPSVSSNETMTSSKKPANMKTLSPSPALKSVRKSPKSKQLPNIDPGSEDEVLEHTSESGSQGSKNRASLSSKSSSSTPAAGLPFENEIEHQPSPSVSSNETMEPSEQSEHLPNRKKRKTVHQTNDTTSPNLNTVQGNNVSLKIWCPDGTKRSTKDITELDIVLDNFSNIITNYKHKVESDVCLRTVDRFLTSLKKQLTDTIEEVQKLKVIQRKNTKIGAEINKKRKRLLTVNDELIVTRHQLKQLQKEYAQLEEKQSSLKIATQFLTDLEELQKEYMQYRKKAPKEKEEYGVSSLPALLLESRSILSAEKHLQGIGSKLQTFLDEERPQETQ
ncbi:centromere protein U isoform X2 [Lissotriton helveticus]